MQLCTSRSNRWQQQQQQQQALHTAAETAAAGAAEGWRRAWHCRSCSWGAQAPLTLLAAHPSLIHCVPPHVVVTPDLQYRMVKQFPRGKYKPITILEKCDDCPPDLDVPGAHHVH